MSELGIPANEEELLYEQVQDWKTKLGAAATAPDSGSSHPPETAVPDPSGGTAPNP